MSWSSIGKCNLLKSGGHTQLTLDGDEVKLKDRPDAVLKSLADGEA